MLPAVDKTLDGVQNAGHRSILVPFTLASSEFFSHGSTALFVRVLFIEVPCLHLDTPHSVGLLWKSVQPDARRNLHLTKHKTPSSRMDSTPISNRQAAAD
jgi:hypothetical protein